MIGILNIKRVLFISALAAASACGGTADKGRLEQQADTTIALADTLLPAVITEAVKHDSDDPAIWINSEDPAKSLIIGTDKDTDGGIYAFDLNGEIIKKVENVKRPNNVDIAYGFLLGGKRVDIAVATERETNRLRVYSLPDLVAIDNGGIEVFTGEQERSPMGIALYTRPTDQMIYAVVGRKSGPADGYLWQYKLVDAGNGSVKGEVVRKFGKYSGKKEIEAIAVDNEMGYIYYSDEQMGVRKYMADPELNNNKELALFAQSGYSKDHEGIAIYKTGEKTGYLLVSNQGSHTFMVYPRAGSETDINAHDLITEISVKAIDTDGADATSVNLGAAFPEGVFVAMSTDKTFHIYDWRAVQKQIDLAVNK